ncbi:hypothetical protein P692DRAFT_201293394 [Suillus brevipes Sb2]|nr:hypothetical protein P692DRAFT_201293394 [Suillus brevipes Sb2]
MSIIELKYIGALNHGSVMTRYLGWWASSQHGQRITEMDDVNIRTRLSFLGHCIPNARSVGPLESQINRKLTNWQVECDEHSGNVADEE